MRKQIRNAALTVIGLVTGLLFASMSIAEKDTVYVRAGTLVDVQTGRLVTDQLITLRGERIESVSNASGTSIPADAKVIDLSDSWVMPGLIDMHDHLTGSSDYQGYDLLQNSVPREALFGVTNGLKTLQAGFTTVRNVGAAGYSDVALRDAINAGEIEGPRLRVSGPATGITGGHCDNNMLPAEYDVSTEGIANGPWVVRTKVREKYGMTPMESIQAATVNAADLLGWPDDVGAINEGFYADIIAVKENPLENINAMEDVSFVMKGGKVYKQ